MVYECEKCGSALPAGVLACPKCGEVFEEIVPQDAETATRGWQPKSEAAIPPSMASQPQTKTPVTPKVVILGEHHPDPPQLNTSVPSAKSQSHRPTPDYQQAATASNPKIAKTPIWLYVVGFFFLPITLLYLIGLAIVKIWKQPGWPVTAKSFLTVLVIAAVALPAVFSKYPDAPSQGNGQTDIASPEPLGNQAQKSLDAANAMDEQNSHDAWLKDQPPPPKIGIACGPPAKTNPDGTISISARRLYYDYVTDGPAANEKYQSKTLKVTGTFLDWENDDDGDSDNNGDHVYLVYLVSGNTWIDNDPQSSSTHVYSISCSFDGTVPKAFTHRIIKARDNTSIIVSVICTCTCDDPTTTDPMIKLNCSSIKIVNNIH